MNKKFIFVLILFLPAIIAGIWYLSVSGDNFTVANVSAVTLTLPSEEKIEYTTDSEKEFFVEFRKNISSIEKQTYDPEVYSLYRMDFARVQGDVTYYLCLSADVKNCLAYDEYGNWYRIDKEYAKSFLALHNVSSVYRNSELPVLHFNANGETTVLTANSGSWHYLLSDETYCDVNVETRQPDETSLCVTAGEGFDFEFDVEPDWYNVKIYDGDNVVYDGILNSVTEFSSNVEAKLLAVISAEWYTETTDLYNGEATYSFYFDFDIKATYTLNKDTCNSGEVVYIKLQNVSNEVLEVTSAIPGVSTLTAHEISDCALIIVPIPMDTEAGEYRVSVKSDKTALSIPITVKAKDFGTVDMSFVGSESLSEYESAQRVFLDEISSSFDTVLPKANWANGLLTPVVKFVDGEEQYWVSLPSYGVNQRFDGTLSQERSLGIHYVKAVAAEELPVRSVAVGQVAYAGKTSLYGNTVVLEHGFGFKTVYGHLDSINLNAGDLVQAGTILGNADPDGFSVSSTELFFGICVDGVFVNPYNFIVEPRSETASDTSSAIDFVLNIAK